MAKRPRTPAQLANDRKMREAAQARNVAAAAEGAVGVLDPTVEDDEDDGTLDLMAKIAKLAGTAAHGADERKRKVARLEQMLSEVDPFKYPELADSDEIQTFVDQWQARTQGNKDIRPGELVGTGLAQHKKAWTYNDVLHRMMEWINTGVGEVGFKPVTFIPMETIPITWNGLAVTVIAREEATVPECYYAIYTERYKALVSAEEHVQIMFRKKNQMDTRRADPTIMTPRTAMIRGRGQGTYFPGAGGFEPGTPEAGAQ